MVGAFIVRNWTYMLLKGILGVAFGIILLVWPRDTIEALLIIFGIFALLVGIIFAIAFFAEVSRKEKWGLSLGIALVSIFLGILAIVRTETTAVVFLFLLAAWLLAFGAIQMALGTSMDPQFKLRWLVVIEGIVSIIVGLCLLLFTAPTLKLLVFFFGLYIILMGIIDIVVSFMLRKYIKAGGPEVIVVEG
ncbi:MAG: DUF308 domain-containing protein [Actinomycetota bacterium]